MFKIDPQKIREAAGAVPASQPLSPVELQNTELPEDVTARLATLEAELQALRAAREVTPEPPAAPSNFPGETGRAQVGTQTLVSIEADWKGQTTLGIRLVERDGALPERSLRDLQHTLAWWQNPLHRAALRLALEVTEEPCKS